MTRPVFRFLVSFHYHQRTDLKEIADSYDGPCEVFADSGAYSAASLGVQIDLKEYAAWLKDWQRLLTVRATLDVIGDPQATARNTAKLESMGLPVLPVFHVGTPFEKLEELCQQYDYIALGGMVPHTTNPQAILRWLVRCFQIARHTGTVFHGFGQTQINTLKLLPFYSADSSTWSSGARFGAIVLWDDKRQDFVRLSSGDASAAKRYAELLRSHGADPALVGRRGFAILSKRTPEQFRVESTMMRGAPAVAYLRMGDWLAGRHQVPRPASLGAGANGSTVYLADTVSSHLTEATATMNRVYDTNSPGTNVYLAETLPVNLKTVATHLGRAV